MRIVGVDCGLGGALVLLEDGQPTFRTTMPVVEIEKHSKTSKSGKKIKREYLEAEIVRFLKAANPDHVVIERQSAMPGQGGTSMLSIGIGFGIIRGICAGLQLPFSLVQPVVWQRAVLGSTTGGDKSKVLLFCNRRWPKVSWIPSDRARTPHDGLCDAAVIALHGYLTLRGTPKAETVANAS